MPRVADGSEGDQTFAGWTSAVGPSCWTNGWTRPSLCGLRRSFCSSNMYRCTVSFCGVPSNRSSPNPGRQRELLAPCWRFCAPLFLAAQDAPRGMWGVRLESGQAQSSPQHEMPRTKCHPKHGISSSDGPSANCRAAIAAKSIIPPLVSFESSGGSPTDQGSGKGNVKGTSDTERASCFTQGATQSVRFSKASLPPGGVRVRGVSSEGEISVLVSRLTKASAVARKTRQTRKARSIPAM